MFTLANYTVDYKNVDPGLVLHVTDLLATPTLGSLDVGGSVTFNLFRVYTEENSVDWNEGDRTHYPISVSFNFSTPGDVVTQSVTGESYGVFLFDIGRVEWDGPAFFSFGTDGLFKIALSDVHFGTPGGANVAATLSFLHDSNPRQVPEPSTLMLLGAGLVGLALLRRRQHR